MLMVGSYVVWTTREPVPENKVAVKQESKAEPSVVVSPQPPTKPKEVKKPLAGKETITSKQSVVSKGPQRSERIKNAEFQIVKWEADSVRVGEAPFFNMHFKNAAPFTIKISVRYRVAPFIDPPGDTEIERLTLAEEKAWGEAVPVWEKNSNDVLITVPEGDSVHFSTLWGDKLDAEAVSHFNTQKDASLFAVGYVKWEGEDGWFKREFCAYTREQPRQAIIYCRNHNDVSRISHE